MCCYIMRNMLLLIMLNIFNVETQTYEAGALPAATATTCSKGRSNYVVRIVARPRVWDPPAVLPRQ